MRGLAYAILAVMTTAIVQATLFFQFWTYFVDVRGLGAVAATLQFAPFVFGMLRAPRPQKRTTPTLSPALHDSQAQSKILQS